MPHFIIEHNESILEKLSPRQLLDTVYTGALESELFDEQSIKVRLLPYAHYCVGSSDKDFIHVQAKILTGRDILQKQQLSRIIVDRLKAFELDSISITVEVVDLDTDSYAKVVV